MFANPLNPMLYQFLINYWQFLSDQSISGYFFQIN